LIVEPFAPWKRGGGKRRKVRSSLFSSVIKGTFYSAQENLTKGEEMRGKGKLFFQLA